MNGVIRAADLEDDSNIDEVGADSNVDLEGGPLPGDDPTEGSEAQGNIDTDINSDIVDTTVVDESKETDATGEIGTSLDDISDEQLEGMSDDELEKLLNDIDEEQEDSTEEIDSNSTEEDIKFTLQEKDALIKSLSDRLESKIKENADLKIDSAERSIFEGDDNGEVSIFQANISKARGGDESAKSKLVGLLDSIRKEITGKGFSDVDIENDASSASSENSGGGQTSPSDIGDIEDEDEEIKVI